MAGSSGRFGNVMAVADTVPPAAAAHALTTWSRLASSAAPFTRAIQAWCSFQAGRVPSQPPQPANLFPLALRTSRTEGSDTQGPLFSVFCVVSEKGWDGWDGWDVV